MKNALILLVFLIASPAFAGVMEVSYTYATRSSFIDADNFQKSTSHTGSFAWYFLEMSALELSYTKGNGEVSYKSPSTTPIKILTELEIYDASLVFTLAQKDWTFQPYIKGGAAWVDKKIYKEDAIEVKLQSKTDKTEPVPSWGVGFRLLMSQHISLKCSYDRWRTGKSGNDDIWDDSVRAGLSVMF